MDFFKKISFLLKRNEIGSEYLLALDIGTEFVKALVFSVNKKIKEGVVLGAATERQMIGNMLSGAVANIGGVVEVCKRAIKEASFSAGVKNSSLPFQSIIGIAGEFVRGAVTTLNYERENSKSRIDLTEFKNIIQKIQWRAYNRIRHDMSEEIGISELEVKLINAAIIDIKIDGYRVTNPLGFQGKEITLSIFNAYAPLVHLGALQSIISDLGLELLFIVAEPYALARTITPEKNGHNDSDQTNHLEEAIFIDLGGGTTDIAVVRHGGIEGIKSLAFGGRAFSKRLAQIFELSLNEAEEIKIKYSKDEVSDVVKKKIGKIFEQDINLWLRGVRLALEDFSQVDLLPNQIFLCGGASLLPSIKSSLESGKWWSGLSMSGAPAVSFIKPENIAGMRDGTGELKDPQDITPLALAALALDLIQDEDYFIKSLLRKTIKLIQT